MTALDSAVQVNVEVTSIPCGKASCRKGFQNFTELYVSTLHTSLTLLLQDYEENLPGLQRRSMTNTTLNSIDIITPIQDMDLLLLQ